MQNNAIKLEIPEVRATSSSESIGSFKLMEHQLRVYNSSSKFIIQNVPTSGGKTLAALLNVLKNGQNAVFIYPTNALLYDQIRSLKRSIEHCGYSAKILGEESIEAKDICILPVSGELLDKKSLEYGKRISHGEVIKKLMAEAQGNRIIMLTNPDILFLIVKGEFRTPLSVFKEFIIGNFKTLVLDEFHLYHSYSLANLIFLLSFLKKKIQKIIVSSATITNDENNTWNLLSELYGNPEIITPSDAKDGESRIIRHKTDLTIRGIPSGSPYLFYPEDVKFLVNAVNDLYTRHKNDQSRVKVLIILNSVVFVEQVRQELENIFDEDIITPIHGLIPKRARLKPSEFSDIVIGTSAIEVGVDFDTASLIFEANNASSFIQRLGRGARHTSCETLALVPLETLPVLRNELGKKNEESIPYQRFAEAVNSSLENMPAYTGFVKSRQGEMLYLAFLYRFINAFILSGELSKENRDKEISNCIENRQFQPPFFNPQKLRGTFDDFASMDGGKLIKVTSRAGFRDFSMEIPAYFEQYGIVDSINVLDLRKLNFKVQDFDIFKPEAVRNLEPQKRKEINTALDRFRLQGREKIAIVRGIRREQIKIYADLNISKHMRRRPFYIDDKNTILKCDSADTNFMKEMQHALIGVPGYHSYSKEDWRMPAIPCVNNQGFLIIGASAFVKCFLENEQKGKD
ncbi:MAG: type I-D CRISPR-associated helicase Cas3' [Candidatus Jordarchaeaceae archaeon]